jgi:exodeoxyribonuclease VII large subunit
MALKSRDLSHLASALHSTMHRVLEQYQNRLRQAAGALDVLSPLATLGRGYGIVQRVRGEQVELVGSIEELKTNDTVSIRLRDGALNAQVLSLVKETA